MTKFSNEISDFFSQVENNGARTLKKIPPSADQMRPGDIIIFDYPETNVRAFIPLQTQRAALIVRTKRGNGVFPGKTGKLVSCFKLNSSSDVIIELIMSNLYSKKRPSSYYSKIVGSLKALIGTSSFRTYRLNRMLDIFKLEDR